MTIINTTATVRGVGEASDDRCIPEYMLNVLDIAFVPDSGDLRRIWERHPNRFFEGLPPASSMKLVLTTYERAKNGSVAPRHRRIVASRQYQELLPQLSVAIASWRRRIDGNQTMIRLFASSFPGERVFNDTEAIVRGTLSRVGSRADQVSYLSEPWNTPTVPCRSKEQASKDVRGSGRDPMKKRAPGSGSPKPSWSFPWWLIGLAGAAVGYSAARRRK